MEQHHPIPVAWFDFEATGLAPFDKNNVKVVEVAVSIREGDTQAQRRNWDTLVYPDRAIPIESSNIHGILDRHVEGKPTFAEIADTLYALMHNKIWAGHNVRKYDIPLLLREYKLCQKKPPLCLGIIDTLEIANEAFRGRANLQDCKLQTLCHYADIIAPGAVQRHRAATDVELTIKLCKFMASQLYMEYRYPALKRQLPVEDTVVVVPKTTHSVLEIKKEEPGVSIEPGAKQARTKQAAVAAYIRPTQCQAYTLTGAQCRNMARGVNMCARHREMVKQGKRVKTTQETLETPVHVPEANR